MQAQQQLKLPVQDLKDNMKSLDISSGINGSIRHPFEIYLRNVTDTFMEFRAYTMVYRQMFWGRIDYVLENNETNIQLDGMCSVNKISDIMHMCDEWISREFVHIGASMKNRIVYAMMDNGPPPYMIKEYEEYRLAKRAVLYIRYIIATSSSCVLDQNQHVKQTFENSLHKTFTSEEREMIYGKLDIVMWSWNTIWLCVQDMVYHDLLSVTDKTYTYIQQEYNDHIIQYDMNRRGIQQYYLFETMLQSLLKDIQQAIDKEEYLIKNNDMLDDLFYNKEYYNVKSTIDHVRQENKYETQFHRRTTMADILVTFINDCTILHIDEYINLRKRIDHLLLIPVYSCDTNTMKKKLMNLPQKVNMNTIYAHMCHMLTTYEKNLQLKYSSKNIPSTLFEHIGKILSMYAVYDEEADIVYDTTLNRIDTYRTEGTTYEKDRKKILRDLFIHVAKTSQSSSQSINELRTFLLPKLKRSGQIYSQLDTCPTQDWCHILESDLCNIWPDDLPDFS